ncbi:ABC transporter permease [Actinotalea sp. K2]|uniref:ABC transporter permease n=1 Tax=Actinotalea sp. K2 TaxID=2939438 RepID=UPI002017540D|nr:ABC transporter permease [Actinotalea sp. K2]MCL3859618.1 ABC transporter permease [Actinotalea sp. K2]
MNDIGLLGRQVRHELVALTRTPITMILSIAFPLVFFLIVAAFVGNETIDARAGIRVAQFLAPAFASFGVVMATFSFLAIGFAEAQAGGVLRRQAGTPLPRWGLLGGRIGAAVLLGLLATVLVVATGVAFYGVQLIGRTLPAVVVTLLVAGVSFSALGLAAAAWLPPQATTAVTNGVAIVLAFVSDIFAFGDGMPGWMSTLGWVFPLKHLVNALGDGFNPYLDGSGWAWDHLGVIVLWGLVGAALAVWGLRHGQDRASATGTSPGRAHADDVRPRRTGSVSARQVLGSQVGHGQRVLWRDPSSAFFAVVFPVLLVAVIPVVNGGGTQQLGDSGLTLGAFFAVTMAVYGAGVTAYVNMPQGLAEDRERGVLKRLRGTPVPAWALLTGRVVAALVVSVLTLLAAWALAMVMYGAGVPASWPVMVGVFVVAAVCFAVLGLAVLSLVPSGQAVVGVTLGTLLPLSFVSDVFLQGVVFPDWLERLTWVFPLRHATRAMTEVTAGLGVGWWHLGVIALWTLGAAVVVVLRFRWTLEAMRPGTRARAERAPDPTRSEGNGQ